MSLWIDDQNKSTEDPTHPGVIVVYRAPYQGQHLLSAPDATTATALATAAGLATTTVVPWGFVQQQVVTAIVAANAVMAGKVNSPTIFVWRQLHGREVVTMADGSVHSADDLDHMGPGVVAHFDSTQNGWVLGA